MTKVAIVKGKTPQDMTVKALQMVNADVVLSKEKPILVKPNYINARHPSTGITTDSRVIEGVIKFLKQHNMNEIIVGEGSGFADTFEAFRVAGVDAVAERWKVNMVDLNKDEFVEVIPQNPLALKKVKIAKTALESTIISVPKLKPHRLAGVTLSLKNMMGAVTPKGSIHNRLSKKLVDLVSIIKPRVAVIDGIIAGEGHETSGNAVEMNLVIAGLDPVAVDAVGAAVMGIPPESVKHLRLAEEKGLGTCHLEEIEILGEPIARVKKKFKTSFLSKRIISDLSDRAASVIRRH
ncbi:MAG: DUF362 domain-containing protein [Candidatus Bathyarchaeota archaeon]|nr:DUF362 domain-containing protein [Candidatus Bathyarchaeota archaeon]MDH5733544.1 DUF362 domain-containing protein [Candidatus Bathyarchaeota archaeon]